MSLELESNPSALRQGFYSLESPRDIAKLLQIDFGRLVYHLHKTDPKARYKTFAIPKKSGGSRTISSPATALKIIQSKTNQVLQEVYPRKDQIHGFLRGKSILSNATVHTRKRLVLNIDLENFFPSINLGRVRGMLMAVPYNRPPSVATVLANICCFDNQLPQGAPTSPIISNMICAKMDSQLLRLAKKAECSFTRYADDLTFSISKESFPSNIATVLTDSEGKSLSLGDELVGVIDENGFKINNKKVRLQRSDGRQVVTGLVTNQFPNVKREFNRQIRAMLHAWRKFGLVPAEKEFHERYYDKHRNPNRSTPSFKKVLQGKIEFFGSIRGKSNPGYIKFRQQLRQLAPELVKGIDLQPEVISDRKNSYVFRRDGIEFDQLLIDIEDEIGIRLRPFREGDIVEGYLKKQPDGVSLLLCNEDKETSAESPHKPRKRILNITEEKRLGQLIDEHVPQPLAYQGQFGRAVTRYAASIGRIIVTDKDQIEKFATGFLFAKPDLVLTAAHVVNSKYVTVGFIEFGNVQAHCKILDCDEKTDIAVLKLDREIYVHPIKIRYALQMPRDRGVKCVAIGFPNMPGFNPDSDVRELSITGIRSNYLLKQELLALSVDLGPGMSGSPIIDEHLSLVGMVIGYPSDGNGDGGKQGKWSASAVSCNEILPVIERFSSK
jgi:RNA-directed DNA polymerase